MSFGRLWDGEMQGSGADESVTGSTARPEPPEPNGLPPYPGSVPPYPADPPAGAVAEPANWRPLPVQYRAPAWPPSRRDWIVAAGTVAVLVLVGAILGVVWAHVAPRLAFRVYKAGTALPVTPESEEFVAADVWFTVLVLAAGLVAGLAGWFVRSVRGPLMLAALAVGGVAAAVVTWRVGVLLGPGPTRADLQVVGRIVYPRLTLGATAALMVQPIASVAVYLLCVGVSSRDDLGRSDRPPEPTPPRD